MRHKPLVSVIIIFLNAEKFLLESIASVFAQTYDSWELWLVDDGSTDASTEIAQRYAAQEPGQVCYLEHAGHQNRGMSASRNLGISYAKGEYIAFLDADDVWLPHKLERQLAILHVQPEVGMVYGSPQLWYSWTGNPEDSERDVPQGLGIPPNFVVKAPALLLLFLEGKAPVPCPSDVLVRREVVRFVGGFEEVFRSLYEDQVFFTKVCLRVPVFVSSECWTRYRQHPDSCCAVGMITGEYYAARPIFLNWVEGYLSRHRIKDPEISKTLHREFWPYRHPSLHRLCGRSRHLVREMKNILKWIARQTRPVVYSRRST
jgi:glycosyltransferase involved in cell wall biosynthesis